MIVAEAVARTAATRCKLLLIGHSGLLCVLYGRNTGSDVRQRAANARWIRTRGVLVRLPVF